MPCTLKTSACPSEKEQAEPKASGDLCKPRVLGVPLIPCPRQLCPVLAAWISDPKRLQQTQPLLLSSLLAGPGGRCSCFRSLGDLQQGPRVGRVAILCSGNGGGAHLGPVVTLEAGALAEGLCFRAQSSPAICFHGNPRSPLDAGWVPSSPPHRWGEKVHCPLGEQLGGHYS